MAHENPPKDFPVIRWQMRRKRPDCPASIPWSSIQPHEAQAKRNHCGQSLAVLASRGGLSPLEAVAAMAGSRVEPWAAGYESWDAAEDAAVDTLILLVQEAAE